MFVTTQHHLLNTLVDSSGKPQISVKDEVMFVKRKGLFPKDTVLSIFKVKPVDPLKSTATITIPTIQSADGGQAGVYRLKMYMRQSGQTDSRMANNLVFQGKPFMIEFEIPEGKDAKFGAEQLVRMVEKVQFRMGDDILTAKSKEDKVTLLTADEYRIITEVELQKLDGKDFVTLVTATRKNDILNDGKNTIYPNQVGVGTYETLLRSVRYPTSTARRFGGINQEELPMPNTKYVQYTIHICKDRGVMGTDSLGDTVKAASTHIFYVKEDLAAKFEAHLTELGVKIEDREILVEKPEEDITGGAGKASSTDPLIKPGK